MASADCLRCGTAFDAASCMGEDRDAVPEASNISICLYCLNIALFTGNGLELREPTLGEQMSVVSDPDVRRVYNGIIAMWIRETGGDRFPCGCAITKMTDKHHLLFYKPCSIRCSIYSYFLEATERNGTPMDVIELDDDGRIRD